MLKLLISIGFASFISYSYLFANDSVVDDLDGFDMQEFVEINPQVSDEALHVEPIQEKEEFFTLSGDLAFKTSVGYKNHEVDGIDYSGINQAQTSLYLQLDSKLSDNWKMRISGDAYYDAIYDVKHDGKYSKDIEDEYRTQLRFDDVYVQGRVTNDIDLKIGRQIVVWGKSDNIRITDVINPLDNRLPGMTDIEDLRLSTGMAKLDYYIGDWNFSFMAIAENRIMIEAPARSEFFPVDSIFPIAPDPFLDLVEPSTSWDNMQYAFAANGIFSGWDLSFYAADVLDQKWYMDSSSQTRRVSKVKMLGIAINIASGSWLLKSETAFLDGVRYNSTKDDKKRFDALVGVDYSGITDTVLSLEFANRHIFDYEPQMGAISGVLSPDYVDKDEKQTAIRATSSFLNDKLDATLLISMNGSHWQYGGFSRAWIDYELANALNASFGIVDYVDGDRPYTKSIKDNDRVFLDITYSF